MTSHIHILISRVFDHDDAQPTTSQLTADYQLIHAHCSQYLTDICMM